MSYAIEVDKLDMIPVPERRFVNWLNNKSGMGKAIFDTIEEYVKNDDPRLESFEQVLPAECKLYQMYLENDPKIQTLINNFKQKG